MQRKNLVPSLRRWLLPVFAGVVLSACSLPGLPHNQAPAKVDVDTLQTDIIFGVPKPQAAPAPTQPPVAIVPPTDLTQPGFTPFTGNNFTFPAGPAVAACPPASSTSFPAEVAGSDVTKLPTEGQYRWALSGTYDLQVLTSTVPVPLGPFEQHVVRQAKTFVDTVPALPGSQPAFDSLFQTVEPRHGQAGFLAFTWQVKDNAFSQTAQGQTAGDPEAGLTLKQVDVLDANGKVTSTSFKGTPGLMILPLPVQPGTTINSVSTDSSGTANNMKFAGTVGNRERVDACGEPIQAWAVDGTLTPTGTGSANPATIHLDVATQLGGLIVALNVAGATDTSPGNYFTTNYRKLQTRLGQLKPDPTPANLK